MMNNRDARRMQTAPTTVAFYWQKLRLVEESRRAIGVTDRNSRFRRAVLNARKIGGIDARITAKRPF